MRWFIFALLLFIPLLPVQAGRKKETPVGTTLSTLAMGPTIVLDAGHGGTDQGARANKPYCEEKKIALLTARSVKKYLNQLGYHVIMTRNTDAFVPLPDRASIANKANSELFVSIHFNSCRNPTAQGIEVFFCDSKENSRRSFASRKLASSVLTRVIRRTNAISRGVKKGNLYVLRETDMPAILVEGGFISNPQERSNLKDHEYLDRIARGVADGIDYYFKKTKGA